jgi:heme exporter protein CcmB
MTFVDQATAVAVKDLRIEWRGRHATAVVAPFAATQLLAFGLSLGPGRALLEQTSAGLLWLAVLFASVLAFRGAYESEGEDGALEGLVLAPIDKAAVFMGKALAVSLQLWALELFAILISAAMFGVSLTRHPLLLALGFMLGTIGLAAVGSLFAVLTEVARSREAILPLLVLPLTTPLLIAGVKITSLSQAGQTGEALNWLLLLVAFDLVFLATGLLLFEHLLED